MGGRTEAGAGGGPRRAAVVLLVCLGLTYPAWLAAALLAMPAAGRVAFIPDDAFYYLTLARNFADQGRWSFDSGTSLTTGFHPLFAYLLACLYALVNPSVEGFVRLSLAASWVLLLPAYALAGLFVVRASRLAPALLLFVFLLSRNHASNAVSAMEWSAVVSLAAGYCALFARAREAPSIRSALALFACGALGSLARTDFGLLPGCLGVAALGLAVHRRDGPSFARAKAAWVGVGGAAAGVAIAFAHNYAVAGELIQSSARMKALWLHVYGSSFRPILETTLVLFGKATANTERLVWMVAAGALVLGMGGILGFGRRTGFGSPEDGREHGSAAGNDRALYGTLWLGCALAVGGYLLLYSRNPAGMQSWYTANLAVPLFLALSLPTLLPEAPRALSLALLLALSLLAARQVPVAFRFPRNPDYPCQVFMHKAGLFLRDHPPGEKVGSWNAGIIGYYQGGSVVNLDGLVNSDIHAYARRNALPEYVDRASIGCILDFEHMLASWDRRKRGGYEDSLFLARLAPARSFNGASPDCPRLTLFRVLPRGTGGTGGEAGAAGPPKPRPETAL